MTGFYDALGVDESGLPTHLPMGLTAEGEGPARDAEAESYVCWCQDARCPLTYALRLSHEAGRRSA